jgi:hypothetical protein
MLQNVKHEKGSKTRKEAFQRRDANGCRVITTACILLKTEHKIGPIKTTPLIQNLLPTAAPLEAESSCFQPIIGNNCK